MAATDGDIKFGASTEEARKEVKSLADLVDDLASESEKPHTFNLDSDGAKNSLAELKTLALGVIGAEAITNVGSFMSSFEEKGKGAHEALRKIGAQTGLMGDDLDALGDRADDLFLKGLGENVETARIAMGGAQKVLGELLDPAGVDAFTLKMAGAAKVFEGDVTENIEKSRTSIQAWGLEGERAGDLVSLGLQKAVTPSNDFLDTLSEYAPLMKEAGFSASEFTGTLIAGAEGGAFSLDKVADSAKEAQIRLKAGDISTALADIASPITSSIAGIVKAGEQGIKTTKEVLQETGAAIEKAFDAGQISETMRSQLQVAVAGTPAEELGTELYGRIYGAPIDEGVIAQNAATAGQQMADAIGAETIFDQIGKLGELAVTKVSEFAGPIIGGLGGIMETVGPLIPAVLALWPVIAAGGGIMATVGTAATAMWTAITGPVGLVLLAIGAVVAIFVVAYNTSEDFRNAIDSLWKTISDFVSELWDRLKPVLETVWALIKEIATFIWDVVVAYFKAWWAVISSVIDVIGGLISSITGVSESGSFLEDVLAGVGKAFELVKFAIDVVRLSLAGLAGAFNAVVSVISNVFDVFAKGGIVEGLKAGFDALFSIGDAASEGYKKGVMTKAAELKAIAAESAAAAGATTVIDTATKTGGKVGSAFGTGVKLAVTTSLADLSGDLAGAVGEAFARELRDRAKAAQEIYDEIVGRTTAPSFERARAEFALLAAQTQIEIDKINRAAEIERAAIKKREFDDKGNRLARAADIAKLLEAAEVRHQDALNTIAEEGAKRRAALSVIPLVGVQPIRDLPALAAAAFDPIQEEIDQRTTALVTGLSGMANKVTEAIGARFSPDAKKAADDAIAALEKEDRAIVLSAARRGEMAEEAGRRRIQIANEIAQKEKESADATIDAWGAMAVAAGAAAVGIRDQFRASFDAGIEEVKKGNAALSSLVDDAIVTITGATVAAIANGEDLGTAILGTMFDLLQSMVPIWSAMILGGSFATPQSIITAGGAGLIQWSLMTAAIEAAVSGVRALLGFEGGVVGLSIDPDGKLVNIPGDRSQGDSILALIAAGESMIKREATSNNTPLLEAMNRYPHIDFARELTQMRLDETRAIINQEIAQYRVANLADRHAVRLADEAIKRSDELAKTVDARMKAVHRTLEKVEQAIARGIPIKGTSSVSGRQIDEVLENERRHYSATH